MWKIATAVSAVLFLAACEPVAETTDWDVDADNVGYDEWVPDFYEAGVYDAWDADDDDLLSEDEWQAGFGDRFGAYDANRWGMYSDWDEDASGYLSEVEFASGVFDSYDLDGDAVLLDEEYRTFGNDAWM